MQTFKTKAFARFADREGVRDAALCEAVRRVRAGAIDADLGACGRNAESCRRKAGNRLGEQNNYRGYM
ncbi:MAG: hypothetical protein F4Z95_06085 [Gammaproteobacteria bacterium]|nr:hypothetical protein [Gammaproteobacteria bacterium]